MAELTELESKLGEVLGLAQAAKDATQKVRKLVDDGELQQQLERMAEEADRTAARCEQVAEQLDGKKTAVREQARETKGEAQEMMRTYLSGDDVDGLDGFEFLIMAEAGELGHWEIVREMNAIAPLPGLGQVVDEVLPIQERHLREAREGSLALARQEARELSA
jgi:hypothetical protein